MKTEYSDALITVNSGVDLSSMGTSTSQSLNDGITIEINSANARVIQFKARYSKWLEGPASNTYQADIEGYSLDKTSLVWKVDSLSYPIPYYDEKGACTRTSTHVTVGDQPDVHPYNGSCKALYFDSSLSFTDMSAYEVKEVFVAASVVIVNNRVERVVNWKRRGVTGAAEYKLIGVTMTNILDAQWKTVLTAEGYTVPDLS